MARPMLARLLAAVVLATIAFSYGGPAICAALHGAPQAAQAGAHHHDQHSSTGARLVPGADQSACMAPAHCGTAFGSPPSRLVAVSVIPENGTDIADPGAAAIDRVTGPIPPPPRV